MEDRRSAKRIKVDSLDAPTSLVDAGLSPKNRGRASLPVSDDISAAETVIRETENPNTMKYVSSPFQLTTVQSLPSDCNVDTVTLGEICGHPLIKECWAFNYLTDIESKFDPDVRDQIDLKIVHGSWKKEDPNRAFIEEAASRYQNVSTITAYMPEPFGTHHSKMIVTIRHDDVAQICIMTANLIEQDWRMCQAVWRSPWLPLLQEPGQTTAKERLGSGLRFKADLLDYLRAYNGRLKALISALEKFDFGAVKGALVTSIPCQQRVAINSNDGSGRGWPALQQILKEIPCEEKSKPHIVVQVSSIATLGVKDTYLRNTFFSTLSKQAGQSHSKPRFSIIYPTVPEIRRSVDGYTCGASIHMRIQTPQNQKQLDYLRPFLCRWAPDLRGEEEVRRAGRRRVGPHIKTYIRFADEAMTRIDWAMVTSSNLSKQAWGAESNKEGTTKICSYEIGVVVWPALWKSQPEDVAVMVPTFKRDLPDASMKSGGAVEASNTTIGFRMPYDLPLMKYGLNEEPWCLSKSHLEPDSYKRIWGDPTQDV